MNNLKVYNKPLRNMGDTNNPFHDYVARMLDPGRRGTDSGLGRGSVSSRPWTQRDKNKDKNPGMPSHIYSALQEADLLCARRSSYIGRPTAARLTARPTSCSTAHPTHRPTDRPIARPTSH